MNLLPGELLPVPLPWLTAGLALLAAGLVMLLYALFWMKTYSTYEVQDLKRRVGESQETARQLGIPVDLVGPGGQLSLPPGVLDDWAELRARQVDWAAVFSTIATSVGPNLQISGLSQAGYNLTIAGEASSSAEANQLLQKLRQSGLFASLEMNIAGQPDAVATALAPGAVATPGLGANPQPGPGIRPSAVPTAAGPAPGAPPQSGPGPAPSQPGLPNVPLTPPGGQPNLAPSTSLPTVAPIGRAPTQAPTRAPAPPAAGQPAPGAPGQPAPGVTSQPAPRQPTATLAPRTPLATPSPLGSPPTVAAPATQGPPATATPAYDFTVQSKRETVDQNAIGNNSTVRVRVIDATGKLVPGLRAHIESQGQPPWGADLPRDGGSESDGTFAFPVGMGKFTVYILNGSSERATDLFTGVQGQPGVHVWDVTYLKSVAGTPPANPVCTNCTPTLTPTWTQTVAPTATPISVGQNIANLACVTASYVSNDAAATRAVDGDVNTAWDSGVRPVQQITFDFTFYPSNDPNPQRRCTPKAAGERTSYTIEALEAVTNMSDRSKVTHEVWTVYDTGSAQLEYTFADVDAGDNQTLSTRFSGPRNVQRLQIRTTRSNVNVGWREVRLYQPLPPAFGTLTATPTWTPTYGATTATPTPLSFATVAATSAGATSENPGNPASAAIDSTTDTFWRPVSGLDNQYLELFVNDLPTIAGVRIVTAMGAAAATPSATAGPNTPTPTPIGASWRVRVRTQANNDGIDCFTSYAQADYAVVQLSCGSPIDNVVAIRIFVQPQNNQFPAGIRNVVLFAPAVTVTATPTAISTATATATQTGTPTPSDVAAGSTNVFASSVAPAPAGTASATPFAAALANDVTGSTQNAGTYWMAANAPTTSGAEQWTIQFPAAVAGISVSGVRMTLFMAQESPTPIATATATSTATNTPTGSATGTPTATGGATSTPTATLTATPTATGTATTTATPTGTRTAGSGPYVGTVELILSDTSGAEVAHRTYGNVTATDGLILSDSYATPMANVVAIRVRFTGFGVQPGLRTVSVFKPYAPGAAAAEATSVTRTATPTATATAQRASSAARRAASDGLLDRIWRELGRPIAALGLPLDAPPAVAAALEQAAYPDAGAQPVPQPSARPPAVPPGDAPRGIQPGPPAGFQAAPTAAPPGEAPRGAQPGPPSGFQAAPTAAPPVPGAPPVGPVASPVPGAPPIGPGAPAQGQPAPFGPPGTVPTPDGAAILQTAIARQGAPAGVNVAVATPAARGQSQAGAPAPGEPRGRVSFVIVAQVRPGGA